MIVDDEAPARINLGFALAEHPDWQVVACCDSAAEAREFLQQQTVDVLFLDVQMPGETGLAFARQLCQQPQPPLIVFVTAYNNFAVEAFEVHALDYLLKPFDDQRLAGTLQRALALLEHRQQANYGEAVRNYVDQLQENVQSYLQSVSVRSVGKIESVRLSEVQWMQSAGNYVELHLPQRMILHRTPISQFESQLDPQKFIRVHRSVIVSVAQICVLKVVGDGLYQLQLKNGVIVPVSERYVTKLRALL
ncbi:MAG: LytTR family DNA-binding domain-containing protein [Gammaproteobacteria bacterium]|nr:LytTR family DNA-binding domain-containing protein [Gammaproteobacteria bacterium]MBU2056813.1 LytTR family DNA-binding domain-containing protein [Gammaproteobacteria bacterium]MBU2174655.1 LytTR family DNA-binding domain-containing protein [Gammaproteobacteria bacterium]MBU2248348.1 LytTR family DNA-binding domain-containing protein [Gammaproteobacteria bacterium]MBU2346217.1 LytTR family DNA-binding domain-containing protein [Gammaproteobacteria bacterium]